MPTKVIGVGVCPRCGRPGTVVIKRGNYVYVKHGNTWHYIGTLDKVNLNKILVKELEITNIPRTSTKHIYGYSYERLLFKAIKYIRLYKKALIIATISLAILLSIFIITWRIYPTNSNGYNISKNSSLILVKCNASYNTINNFLFENNLNNKSHLVVGSCNLTNADILIKINNTSENITYYNYK